ncbi:asparagine synthetase [glutamine-hydrolyzing] 2 isoform X2 [Spinacia oleracea]|uniref:Asparagine synthetase [glutamine-hydrolyzing] 2 isoform X2 n=1 Tax=Spinacia oleracea TaxID=3562 RepID=A0ABM3RLL4_SPIOL|nr:asparagine synthetase [glutamine-hydrolyzing] 2-like isoform X2 [Spinacia oleracea]XP_056696508.1 asparagine synthetase [glutamine-hydrolyzing] 2-like isoform X2 [Spinacia oleracea]
MKAISDDCERFIAFPSGHIYSSKQGGLDSSLVAAVASRYLEEMEGAYQWGSQLHSFCIGLEAAASLSGSCSLFFEERKHVKVFNNPRGRPFTFEEIDEVREMLANFITSDCL